MGDKEGYQGKIAREMESDSLYWYEERLSQWNVSCSVHGWWNCTEPIVFRLDRVVVNTLLLFSL
jgi:hypothetical protein